MYALDATCCGGINLKNGTQLLDRPLRINCARISIFFWLWTGRACLPRLPRFFPFFPIHAIRVADVEGHGFDVVGEVAEEQAMCVVDLSNVSDNRSASEFCGLGRCRSPVSRGDSAGIGL